MSLIATDLSVNTGFLKSANSVPANNSGVTDIHNNPAGLARSLKKNKDSSIFYLAFHIKVVMKSMKVDSVTIRYGGLPITIVKEKNCDLHYYMNRGRISSETFLSIIKKG